jgi:hypothetical protein
LRSRGAPDAELVERVGFCSSGELRDLDPAAGLPAKHRGGAGVGPELVVTRGAHHRNAAIDIHRTAEPVGAVVVGRHYTLLRTR